MLLNLFCTPCCCYAADLSGVDLTADGCTPCATHKWAWFGCPSIMSNREVQNVCEILSCLQ